MFFDPMYFVFVGPALLLSAYAAWKVQSSFAWGREQPASCGATGAEAAAVILKRAGIDNVGIEESEGHLSDHYDPSAKMLRLSHDVYHGRSLAALGVAAHEAGHAIQDKVNYPLMGLRAGLVPLANVAGIGQILVVIGIAMAMPKLALAGCILFSIIVLFQLVNLPVEFDASSRAKKLLGEIGLVKEEEAPVVRKVLSAAAMTYVAATLTTALTLIYYIFLLNNQREEA